LTVSTGDTIHTTTVDAGGTDEKGVIRVLGGNSETGPFYVETAAPGDVLVAHLTRLSLNRDWAISDDAVVPRGLDTGLAVKMKDVANRCAGIWICTVLAEYSRHYHSERNHQGKGNRLLFPDVNERQRSRSHSIECLQRLGGLLKYYRSAA
jgi:hypothetical protein